MNKVFSSERTVDKNATNCLTCIIIFIIAVAIVIHFVKAVHRKKQDSFELLSGGGAR
ncbi:MAG: hypothetical protein K2K91_06160 [Ruminococcus sp.]|nr:hypothetical protein [Ruminococcus sp.]MDE7097970.1 hypothetical protein [Ruminococcus sp.]